MLLENSAGASCPIEMSPPAVVVRFGDGFSVKCTSLSKDTEGMGWESSAGGTDLINNVRNVTLNIESVTDWNFSPLCYVNLHNDIVQCSKNLPVTVYSKSLLTLSDVSKQSRSFVFSDHIILLMRIFP